MHLKMSSTGRPGDEICEFLLFTVTDGHHFGSYDYENFACLFKRGVEAYFLTNTLSYLKQPSNFTCRRLVTESWFCTLLIYHRLHICRDGHLDPSAPYGISDITYNYRPIQLVCDSFTILVSDPEGVRGYFYAVDCMLFGRVALSHYVPVDDPICYIVSCTRIRSSGATCWLCFYGRESVNQLYYQAQLVLMEDIPRHSFITSSE